MTAKRTTAFCLGPFFGTLCLAALVVVVSRGFWDVRGRAGLFWDRNATLVVLLGAGVVLNGIVTLFHLVHLGHTPLYRFRDSWFGEPAYSTVVILSLLQPLGVVAGFGVWIAMSVWEKVTT